MTGRRSTGQIFPTVALLLFAFLFFVGANLKRSIGGVAKIENQREADGMVLVIANEQARALNAIAALNEGLRIALERGYAVGVALLTLKACTMAIFSAPYCAPALSRLGAKAVPFYRNLSKLGDDLARMQDEIADWGAKRPLRMVEVFNYTPSQFGEAQLFLFPERVAQARLSIRREGSDGFAAMGASADEVGLAEGRDLKKCERLIYETYSQFDRARKGGRIRLGRNDSLTVEYANPANGFRQTIEVKTAIDLHGVSASLNGRYDFQSATNLKCESLQDLLSGFGLASPIRIPPPYGLEASYFRGKNRLALARVMKNPPARIPQRESLNALLRERGDQRVVYLDSWAISEAEITGGDLTQMGFRAALRSMSLDHDLWDVVRRGTPRLVTQGFSPPPDWRAHHALLWH